MPIRQRIRRADKCPLPPDDRHLRGATPSPCRRSPDRCWSRVDPDCRSFVPCDIPQCLSTAGEQVDLPGVSELSLLPDWLPYFSLQGFTKPFTDLVLWRTSVAYRGDSANLKRGLGCARDYCPPNGQLVNQMFGEGFRGETVRLQNSNKRQIPIIRQDIMASLLVDAAGHRIACALRFLLRLRLLLRR